MSFIDSDESPSGCSLERDFDSEEDYEPSNEEASEDISEEASESDIEPINALPYTVHRQKYIIRIKDYEYY